MGGGGRLSYMYSELINCHIYPWYIILIQRTTGTYQIPKSYNAAKGCCKTTTCECDHCSFKVSFAQSAMQHFLLFNLAEWYYLDLNRSRIILSQKLPQKLPTTKKQFYEAQTARAAPSLLISQFLDVYCFFTMNVMSQTSCFSTVLQCLSTS